MRFSIIIPIYKVKETYLRKCINSILTQTMLEFELILINDGSPDKCPQICDEYAELDNRVRVIHQKNNGLVWSREQGMLAAKGEYICFVDADDWVDKKWLEEVERVIKRYEPDVICLNSFMTYANKEVEISANFKEGLYSKEMLDELYNVMIYNPNKSFYNFGIYPSVWSKVFRKNLIYNNRCTDYEITMGEDAACVYKCLLDANSIYILDKAFYHYRQIESSMTNSYDNKRMEKYDKVIKYLYRTLPTNKYNIENQIRYYKAFLAKHAVDNQSRARVSLVENVQILKKTLNEYGFNSAFRDLNINNASIVNDIFIKLFNKEQYGALMIMCYMNSLIKRKK